MAPKIRGSRSFGAVVGLIVLAVGGIIAGCGGGTSIVETGRSFDPSTFSESEAREILETAVLLECLKPESGVRPLVGPLRRVESASANEVSANWEFHSDGKVATVSPTGRVSGALLEDLTSKC